MSSYSGHAKPPDRAKAIAAVAAVHIALAAVIVTGLNVGKVREAVEQLKTFDIREVPPPPRPPPLPRPAPQPRRAPQAAAAPAPKAQASPVVAPRPKIPAPSPVPAARVAGTGIAANSGAATTGSGTGAGGSGHGTGGGGSDYSRFTPARLISNIPSSQYRRLASTGIPSGLVGVTIRVEADGSIANCRVARSSGDSSIDGLVCQLTVRYVRFSPARDPQGRAVAQDITYFPNWRRR
jgi:periplasmic protein TonB